MIKNYLSSDESKDLKHRLFNEIIKKIEETEDSSMKNFLATNMLNLASTD